MTLPLIEGQQPSYSEPLTSDKDADPESTRHGGSAAVEKGSVIKGLGWLDRFLAVWILLAMIIGVLLGNFVEETGPALQKGQFIGVSVPIALGLLVMMYPILCKVQYETLHHLFRTGALWIQIGFSILMNWIVAPLLMVHIYVLSILASTHRMQLGLAWAFLPDKSDLRTGLVLVGLARCIAMVGSSAIITFLLQCLHSIGSNLERTGWWRRRILRHSSCS
jgi:ACR3 family arsenite transporter